MKKTLCKICRKYFYMGYNGTVDGCDRCTKTVRDPDGGAWAPNEKHHDYLVSENPLKTFRVTRRQALNPK